MRRRRRTRSRRRSWIFWTLLLGVCALASIAMVVWGLPRLAERWLDHQLEGWEGAGVEFRVAHLTPWYLGLERVVVAAPLWEASAERVSVDFLPWHLVRGQAGSVTVHGLEVTYDLDAMMRKEAALADPRISLPELPFERLVVRDAHLRLILGEEVRRFPFDVHVGAWGNDTWGGVANIAGEDLQMRGRASWNSRAQTAEVKMTAKTPAAGVWLDRLRKYDPGYDAAEFALRDQASMTVDFFAVVEDGALAEWSAVADGGPIDARYGDMTGAFQQWALAVRQVAGRSPEGIISGEGNRFKAEDIELADFRFSVRSRPEPGVWALELSHAHWSWGDIVRGTGEADGVLRLGASDEPVEFDLQARWEELDWNGTTVLPGAISAVGDPERFEVRVDEVASNDWPLWRMRDLESTVALPPAGGMRLELAGEIVLNLGEAPVPLGFFVDAAGEGIEALRISASVFNPRESLLVEIGDWKMRADGGFVLEGKGSPEAIAGQGDIALRALSVAGDGVQLDADHLDGEVTLGNRTVTEWMSFAEAAPHLDSAAWSTRLPEILERFRFGTKSGSITIGDIPLDWETLRLEGESTDSEGLDATLELTAAAWAEHDVPSVQITARMDGERIGLQGSGLYSRERVPFALQGGWSGGGFEEFEGSIGPVDLTGSSVFADMNPDFAGWLVSGAFDAQISGGFDARGFPELAGTVSLREGSVVRADSELRAEGVGFSWDLLWRDAALHTDGLQELYCARLAAGEQELHELKMSMSLDGSERARVETLSFQWGGGEWNAMPFDLAPAGGVSVFVFAVFGLDLAEVGQILPDPGIGAQGILDGVVGVAIDGDSVELRPGYLELRQGSPGRIRYDNPGWLTARAGTTGRATSAAGLRAAEEAFSDLTLDNLRIDFLDPLYSYPIRIAVDGRGYSDSLQAEAPVATTVRVDHDSAILERFPLWQLIELVRALDFGSD